MSAYVPYPVKVGAGTLAIAPMPGRGGDFLGDLVVIREWRPRLVLSMTTQEELDRTGAGSLGTRLAADGIGWLHLPVADFDVPDAETDMRWVPASAQSRAILSAGGRVLIHCMGGCGRSGMAALRLMIETGELPDAALQRLRAARPCAVETEAQWEWAMAR